MIKGYEILMKTIEMCFSIFRKKEFQLIVLSSLFWGIAAHGTMIFNKISFHDDLHSLFGYALGSSYTSGRWAAEILQKLLEGIFGGRVYSLPLFNGFSTIVLTASISYLIILLLDIKGRTLHVLISGLLIVFPTVTSLFGYMFTTIFSQTAFLLVTLSVYLIFCDKGRILLPLAVLMSGFAIGIYQAVIPFMLTIVVIKVLRDTYEGKYRGWRPFILEGVYVAVYGILSLIIYLIGLKVSLWYHHAELTTYQGINTMQNTGILQYLARVRNAYYYFFFPPGGAADMYPMSIRNIYYVILVAICLMTLVIIGASFKKNTVIGIQMILIAILLPLAVHFIYVMCDVKQTSIYSLMLYSQVFIFVYFILCVEILVQEFGEKLIRVKSIILIMLLITNILYARYANICYMKSEFQFTQLISYFTELRARITNTEGYKAEYPVAFLNEFEKNTEHLYITSEYEGITIPPYSGNNWINNYNWSTFMYYWIGYAPEIYPNGADLLESSEVIFMPHYPDDGSIKVINEVVVVNF